MKICPNSTPRLKPIRLKMKDSSDKPILSKTDAKPSQCKSPKKNIVVCKKDLDITEDIIILLNNKVK